MRVGEGFDNGELFWGLQGVRRPLFAIVRVDKKLIDSKSYLHGLQGRDILDSIGIVFPVLFVEIREIHEGLCKALVETVDFVPELLS